MKEDKITGEEAMARVLACALGGSPPGWEMSNHLHPEVLEMEVPRDALKDDLKQLWYVDLWTRTITMKGPFKTCGQFVGLYGSGELKVLDDE